MLCLYNADVTLGATTNREQTEQLIQNRERAEVALTVSLMDLVTVDCSATELRG